MTSLQVIIIGLQFSFLWWFFHEELKNYLIDNTREKLFKIRDDFFDSASQDQISFKNPAYQTTRLTLNGMIRFTHELGFIHVLGAAICAYIFKDQYAEAKKYFEDYNKSIKDLPVPSRNLIAEVNKKMHEVTLHHVIKTSPLLMLLLTILIVIMIPVALISIIAQVAYKKFIYKVLSIFWKPIEFEANAIGRANC